MAGYSRNRGLVRALTIWRLLGERRWTLYDLADWFAVHPRTIRRDLDALEAAGYAVRHMPTTGGREACGLWWRTAA